MAFVWICNSITMTMDCLKSKHSSCSICSQTGIQIIQNGATATFLVQKSPSTLRIANQIYRCFVTTNQHLLFCRHATVKFLVMLATFNPSRRIKTETTSQTRVAGFRWVFSLVGAGEGYPGHPPWMVCLPSFGGLLW